MAFRAFGHNLVDRLADHLEDSVGRRRPSSYPVGTPQEELAFWKAFMARSGSRQEAVQAVLERSNQLHDPRYMGHQVAVPFPQEAMLGALTDLLNNGQAIYEMGPTNATLERLLLNEVGQALGLPEGCGGVLCHGGTLGNLVALLAAQRKLGMRLDQTPGATASVRQTPLWCSSQNKPTTASTAPSESWDGARRGGVGEDGRPPSHGRGRPGAPSGRAAQARQKLLAVVGSACTTSAGAYDPSRTLPNGPMRKTCGSMWTEPMAPLQDSAAPTSTSCAACRWPTAWFWIFTKCAAFPPCSLGCSTAKARRALPFVQEAEYLWESAEGQDWWDTGKRTFECTKRMLSTRLATAMFDGGLDKWGHLVDRLWSLAEVFADEVESRPGWELAMAPQANIVCFRPRRAGQDGQLVSRLRARHLRDGASYVVATRLNGEAWLRCTFMNPLTELEDMRTMLDEFERWMAED